jgi:hypothetical protein
MGLRTANPSVAFVIVFIIKIRVYTVATNNLPMLLRIYYINFCLKTFGLIGFIKVFSYILNRFGKTFKYLDDFKFVLVAQNSINIRITGESLLHSDISGFAGTLKSSGKINRSPVIVETSI